MGKTTNKELAEKVSAKIQELLNVTNLKLEGLAILCNIGKSALRSYFSTTLPISLENIEKICVPFSLKLSVFLDFDKPLSSTLKSQPGINDFYAKYLLSNPEYFILPADPNEVKSYPKNDKVRLKYIIYETDYFDTAHSIEDMITDFKSNYSAEFESGRLSQMLKSHLGVLDRISSVKLNKDGTQSKNEVFKYVKKKK